MKKNWIGLIGILFIFLAFLTILKIGFDEGWIPEEAKIALGFVLGVSGLFAGYSFYKKDKKTIGEITAGLGASFLYATFAYSSFSSEIQWSANTLLISMITLSSIIIFIGFRFEMRVLANVSLVGGLLTPIIIRANSEQILLLFFYVLILNIVSIYLCSLKNWNESRFISFIATLIVYSIYYKYFSPESWERPFFYISSFFLAYMIGIIYSSLFGKNKSEEVNLYLGILNGLNFTFWSIFIFRSFHASYAIPLIIVGLFFIGTAFLIYFKSKNPKIPSLLYFIVGLSLIAISGGDLGKIFTTKGMNFVVNAFIWIFIISLFYAVSYFLKEEIGISVSIAGFGIVLFYWYVNAWHIDWVEWFGVKYIPFINPGALVWMSLAGLGFSISLTLDQLNKDSQEKKIQIMKMPPGDFSLIFAIVSHIIVGGLFTIQIENTWKAYDWKFLTVGAATSFSWIVYALSLFLWGSHTKSKVFRIFGSIVLVITTLKVLFSDLSGESTLYKALFLFVMGVLILIIAFINQKWDDQESSS